MKAKKSGQNKTGQTKRADQAVSDANQLMADLKKAREGLKNLPPLPEPNNRN